MATNIAKLIKIHTENKNRLGQPMDWAVLYKEYLYVPLSVDGEEKFKTPEDVFAYLHRIFRLDLFENKRQLGTVSFDGDEIVCFKLDFSNAKMYLDTSNIIWVA